MFGDEFSMSVALANNYLCYADRRITATDASIHWKLEELEVEYVFLISPPNLQWGKIPAFEFYTLLSSDVPAILDSAYGDAPAIF
jgi:hypothetical protein